MKKSVKLNKEKKWFRGLIAGIADYTGYNVYFLRILFVVFTILMLLSSPLISTITVIVYEYWSNKIAFRDFSEAMNADPEIKENVVESYKQEEVISKEEKEKDIFGD